jgi:hypothetical protein
MDDSDALAYVAAAAPLVGLNLSPARLAEVAAAFAQVQRFATPCLACQVPADAEPTPALQP